MSAAARIAAFATGLALLLGAAIVAGGAIDPDVGDGGGGDHGMESGESAMNADEARGTGSVPGLATAADGYRLAPAATTADRGPLQFRHRGEVRTAAFTELVGGTGPAAAAGHNVHGGDDAR